MRTVFFLTIAAILMTGCSSSPTPAETETGVIIHGLGRTPMSMALPGERPERAGFRVVNFGYPSRTETIEELVNRLRQAIQECCTEDKERIHFVTHSMGGIIVRAYLAQYSTDHTGHVVMLSPPNQGSEIADTFADSPILSRLMGPAGSQLGTDSTGILHQLGPASFKLGIIIGNLSLNPLGSWMIPGSDDGKVSIDRARLEGAIAFLVIPATHTFIMNRPDVAAEFTPFLREGRFSAPLASRFAH